MAAELAAEVGAVVVSDTEGGDGVIACARTHVAALRKLQDSSNGQWLIVLEDDAIPIPDFRIHAERALAYARTPLVSFYLGTGNNRDVQNAIRMATHTADKVGATWIAADALMFTVGYAVRRDAVNRLITAIDTTIRVEVPLRITRWAQRVRVGVDYTWPSLVDHPDGYSIIGQTTIKGRRAHRHGTAACWDTGAIALGPVPIWSAA